LPDWALYQKWQLIKRSRAEEINAQNRTVAQQVAYFVHYIQLKGAEEGEQIQFPEPEQFLPFRLNQDGDLSPDGVSERTIKIMWMASKTGKLPPSIQSVILQTHPEVWNRICNQEIVS
jgi:hypothetical protein